MSIYRVHKSLDQVGNCGAAIGYVSLCHGYADLNHVYERLHSANLLIPNYNLKSLQLRKTSHGEFQLYHKITRFVIARLFPLAPIVEKSSGNIWQGGASPFYTNPFYNPITNISITNTPVQVNIAQNYFLQQPIRQNLRPIRQNLPAEPPQQIEAWDEDILNIPPAIDE